MKLAALLPLFLLDGVIGEVKLGVDVVRGWRGHFFGVTLSVQIRLDVVSATAFLAAAFDDQE